MQVTLNWNQKLNFSAEAGAHQLVLDAKKPLGTEQGMTPKEAVLAGLAGCTAMDVAALLNKHKQPVQTFRILVDAPVSEGGHPKVFLKAHLVYELTGQLDPQRVIESVEASQTLYCGVSAMLSRAFPITYEVRVNGELVGQGESHSDAITPPA
jgi:putative redox protein